MVTLETSQAVPLSFCGDGTIRLAGSGVSLDSIVHHFKLGATAEEISQKFPPVELADVYAAITYYLTHREGVEEYLLRQEVDGDRMQERIESAPDYHERMGELRERLLARRHPN